MDIGTAYLQDTAERLGSLRQTAERAIAQVDDRAFFATLDGESNSIAVNLKHVGGNLRSRFTDFLTSDGEKPDRDRESEFVAAADDGRAAIEEGWRRGWETLEGVLSSLTADDLLRTVYIRGEPHTVLGALNRQISHISNHVGQIILLSKHFAGDAWKTLTIPRGASEAFTREMAEANRRG